jgi:hypothetical protein
MLSLLIEIFLFGLVFFINTELLLTYKISLLKINIINFILGFICILLSSFTLFDLLSIFFIISYNIINNYHIYIMTKYYSDY